MGVDMKDYQLLVGYTTLCHILPTNNNYNNNNNNNQFLYLRFSN